MSTVNSETSQQSLSSVTCDGPGMCHAAYGRSTARAGLPAHQEDSGLHPGGWWAAQEDHRGCPARQAVESGQSWAWLSSAVVPVAPRPWALGVVDSDHTTECSHDCCSVRSAGTQGRAVWGPGESGQGSAG